jgi:serine/threonine-protein kinase
MDEDPAIEDVLRAIVTGTPVNWSAVESEHNDQSLDATLSDLRLISRIAAFHRALQNVSDPPQSSLNSGRDRVAAWGSFELLERIGHGSFGEVYRAWDSRLDREVALKLLKQNDPAHVLDGSRAVQEGRLLARVRHEGVVTVYGADVIDGVVGIWMEFIRGRTLDALVGEHGPLSATDAAAVGVTLSLALGAVHRAGLIHRDVKAQNVMRDDDGRIVLMDFGTGQEIAGAPAGELTGTPVYVAPEVLAGIPADAQSDVYSLGVLLFYLVTGTYPFVAPSVAELRQAHARQERQGLEDLRPELPRDFVDIVERATALDRVDRFQTVASLEEGLSSMLEHLAPPPAERSRHVTGFPRSVRGAWKLAVGVVVAGAAAAVVWRWAASSERPRGRNGSSTSLAIAGGPILRKAEVPGFIATGEPSHSGRWLAGVDWNASGNLALLDLFTGTRRVLPDNARDSGGFTEGSAISGDERRIAYSWYRTARQDSGDLLTIDVDGREPALVYHNPEGLVIPVAWAPDGRRVLVVRGHGASADLAWIDTRDGAAAVLTTLPSVPRKASLSPDGGFVAYDAPSNDDEAERDLYITDAATGRVQPLLVHPANDLAPVWVPGGAGVAFASNRSGSLGLWFMPVTRTGAPAGEPSLLRSDLGRFSPIGFGRDASLFYRAVTGTVDVYVASVDLHARQVSSPQTVATRFVGSNLFSDWSPDGRSLVFTSRRGEVGFEPRSQVLVIRDLSRQDERVLMPDLNGLTWPRWSPDGQSIVVKGDGRSGSGLYRVSLRDGAARPLMLLDGLLNFPEWTPDSREVFFVGASGRLRAFNVSTRAERGVLDGALAYTLSRDGRQLAFVRGAADSFTIYVASASGGSVRPVLVRPRTDVIELAGWSPDGTQLVVSYTERPPRQHPAEIVAVPAGGGTPQELATLTLEGARSFRLSPDGAHLAFEAGYPSSSMWVLEQFMNR